MGHEARRGSQERRDIEADRPHDHADTGRRCDAQTEEGSDRPSRREYAAHRSLGRGSNGVSDLQVGPDRLDLGQVEVSNVLEALDVVARPAIRLHNSLSRN